MARLSAGLVVHARRGDGEVVVLAVHPGGPFWARRDEGAWSFPKGEYGPDEDPLAVARREFTEELGLAVPDGETIALGEVRQKGGKRVTAWAIEVADPAALDVAAITSNAFEMEWPPRSGRTQTFPEVDRAEWFPLAVARHKLVTAQAEFVDRVQEIHAG